MRGKEYYVVQKGRGLEKPTIFSSWAKANLAVTGKHGYPRGFKSLDDAKKHVERELGADYALDIKSEDEHTLPMRNSVAYYAVAYGKRPGIYQYFNGKGGAQPEIDGYSHACHKHFRTEEQAVEFVNDWIETYIRLISMDLMERLHEGWMPMPPSGIEGSKIES